jgi:transcription initiation factor TFIIE subunit alpha
MRKKMETSERDATSFHCPCCKKNFSDSEADRLFDPADLNGEFKCNFCGAVVVENELAILKKYLRQQMAWFNNQMRKFPLYKLLREVEDVKLAPALLDQDPMLIQLICNFPKAMPYLQIVFHYLYKECHWQTQIQGSYLRKLVGRGNQKRCFPTG